MIQLIYVSHATAPFTGAALRELLTRARERNAPLAITGFLLHKERSFLQVLEGESLAIDTLVARIGRDARHEQVVVLSRRSVTERNFGDWSMGFADNSGLSKLPGFREGTSLADLAGDAAAVRKIVDGFSDGRWRRLLS